MLFGQRPEIELALADTLHPISFATEDGRLNGRSRIDAARLVVVA